MGKSTLGLDAARRRGGDKREGPRDLGPADHPRRHRGARSSRDRDRCRARRDGRADGIATPRGARQRGDGVANQVEAIVNTFPSLEARAAWLGTVRGFDAYAVIRGEELWAVSPDSDLPASAEIAQRLVLADDIEGAELVH